MDSNSFKALEENATEQPDSKKRPTNVEELDNLRRAALLAKEDCDAKDRKNQNVRAAIQKIRADTDTMTTEVTVLHRENRKKKEMINDIEKEVVAGNAKNAQLLVELEETERSTNFLRDVFGDKADSVRVLLDECEGDVGRLRTLLEELAAVIDGPDAVEQQCAQRRYFTKLSEENKQLKRENQFEHAKHQLLKKNLISAKRDEELSKGITRFDRKSAFGHHQSHPGK